MNAKIKPVSSQNSEDTPSRTIYNPRETPGRLDCYSHYDLEWNAFLITSRNRHDRMDAAVEPELLPNVWNIPRR